MWWKRRAETADAIMPWRRVVVNSEYTPAADSDMDVMHTFVLAEKANAHGKVLGSRGTVLVMGNEVLDIRPNIVLRWRGITRREWERLLNIVWV